jgi:hypothetical protein
MRRPAMIGLVLVSSPIPDFEVFAMDRAIVARATLDRGR